MPTAQSASSNPKAKVNDNKIAKAVAKVTETVERKDSASPSHSVENHTSVGSNDNKTPQDQPEFIKQSLILIEKKVRNLEKRRIKLDEYKATQKKGTPLNEDQLQAVEKYDEVTRTLELARELEKQFVGLANDAMKQQKKQAKKEQIEREEAVKEKLKESQKIISLLDLFGDETVRADFLNSRSGASITENELTMLDDFSKLVEPVELGTKLDSLASESAENIYSLIEGRNKPIQWRSDSSLKSSNTTFAELKKLFDRLFASSYWNKEAQEQAAREAAEAAAAALAAQQQAELEQLQRQQEEEQQRQAAAALAQQISNLAIEQQQQAQFAEEAQQGVYQQNTSDDYVLVNPNDYPQHDNSQKQAFFSTLNPAESRNINEFLTPSNDDNAINFLQDSELTAQQKHEQQQQQEASNNFHPSQQEGGHHRDNRNRNFNNRNGDRNFQQGPPRQRYQDGGNGEQRRGQGQGQQSANNKPRPSNGEFRGGARGGNTGYRGGNNYNGPRNNGPTSNARPAYQQYNQPQNSQVA